MKKSLKTILFLVIGIMLIAGSALTVAYFISKNKVKSPSFLVQIQGIDSLMGQGFFAKAKDQLPELFKAAKNDKEWERILKRTYYIGSYLDDPELLYNTSKVAIRHHKNSFRIIPFMVVASLKTNRNVEASEWATKLNNDSWANLKSLAYLNNDPLKFAESMKGDDLSPLFDQELNSDYDKLYLSAQKTNDDRLWLDAAFFKALAGDKDGIIDMLNSMNDKRAFSEPVAKLYLDVGDYTSAAVYLSEAISRYPSKLGLLVMRGDLAFTTRDLDTAVAIYNEVLQKDPKFSWLPYYNLAVIYQKQNLLDNCINILETSLEYYPDKADLYLFLIEMLAYTERNQEAKDLINKYSDDTEVALINLKWYPSLESPKRRTAKLWDLYNKDQKKESIAEYLAWNSLQLGDIKDAQLALDISQKRLGIKWWTQFYYGVSYVLEGDFEQAIEHLSASVKLQENFYNVMTLAKVLQLNEQWNQAFSYLNKALDIAEADNKDKSILSRIHLSLGEYYINQVDTNKAKLELALAIELDKTNIKASMLYDQLK
ncbi:tetratricopeptide repeat protein [Spirochaeta cellobiosiphila]|uniref:tetratricopeptide repeat protein n=1 Tax=Spirochaeta cellobiosiphila TaxID=504483 RepID=UPI00040F1E51|nr:tetratricopeptide repeat protein [Spirochaeta cellobiosiphila]